MADILIMNIKMPKCCGLCPCFHYEHPMYCQASKDVKIEAPYIYVAKGCPLVEVPTHGRLIDADALQAELEEHSYPSERCWYYAEVGQFIDEAETVLEASK